jgi:SAM-dependent methyltransferase
MFFSATRNRVSPLAERSFGHVLPFPAMDRSRLAEALWRIYHRSDTPVPWERGGDFPWACPTFSRRALQEHLDDSHAAASRVSAERELQLEWMWRRLALQPGQRLLDLTCGPGLYAVELARRGLEVTGIDVSPASLDHARGLARQLGVKGRCHFQQADIREVDLPPASFDACLLLYGQLAPLPRPAAESLLVSLATALLPGGRLCLEILDPERVDKKNDTWWFTDDRGAWGDRPFLHLGERFWEEKTGVSVERYWIVDLTTGELSQYELCDQTYSVEVMKRLLHEAGFARVEAHPAWDSVPLYDREEWVVYVATRGP